MIAAQPEARTIPVSSNLVEDQSPLPRASIKTKIIESIAPNPAETGTY